MQFPPQLEQVANWDSAVLLVIAVWALYSGKVVPGPVHQAAVKENEEQAEAISTIAEAFKVIASHLRRS